MMMCRSEQSGGGKRWQKEAWAASLATREAKLRASLPAFAEALAETGHVDAASAAVGISAGSGRLRLRMMRKDLGWQAV